MKNEKWAWLAAFNSKSWLRHKYFSFLVFHF